MAWLSAGDLETYLQSAGLLSIPNTSPGTLLDLTSAIVASEEAFERDTLWFPFLKQNTDVTRYLDPPEGRLLDLEAGLLALTSVTLAGRTLVLGADFFLLPHNNTLRGLPTTYLEFTRIPSGGRGCIAITGRWGRVETLPEGVKQAVLAKAASLLIPQIHASITKGLMSWREGDVEQVSGGELFGSLVANWDRAFSECVKRYRRLAMA